MGEELSDFEIININDTLIKQNKDSIFILTRHNRQVKTVLPLCKFICIDIAKSYQQRVCIHMAQMN